MRRLLSLGVVVLVLAALSGCGKKQETEEWQPITMESLSAPSGSVQQAPVLPETKSVESKVLPSSASVSTKEIVPLPPQGPYKPTNIEIQTALKNVGFYTGKIDGSLGPKTKKAIESFQSANGLKADGKVGPKTWEVLSKHLSAVVEPVKR
ncbi:MAG: peptidoglycan-binding domain-containing protein [Candidatus Omnitrophica bacterium]|nr:peptidoglycan-binding domain-containing protein [Candidatus Omnitrophota bacterium]